MEKIFLASLNLGKLHEFRQAGLARGVSVEPVPGLASLPPCVEDGRTFEENARKKALHYSQYSEGLIFADDSGISVDALGGAPGVYSARFAGIGADDAANNARLIEALRAVPAAARTARYVCLIALAKRGKILTVTEGRAEGIITEAPRGTAGFGYDPYFLYPSLGKTFAELTAQEKSAVSHRGQAFRNLLDYLQRAGRPLSPSTTSR